MNKKFSLVIALVFLAVQMLSALHMAEHGFLQHKHYGKTCDIATFCEHNQISSASSPAKLPVVVFHPFKNIPLSTPSAESMEYSSAHPRAPPAIFLS